jgi:hypothetical protein
MIVQPSTQVKISGSLVNDVGGVVWRVDVQLGASGNKLDPHLAKFLKPSFFTTTQDGDEWHGNGMTFVTTDSGSAVLSFTHQTFNYKEGINNVEQQQNNLQAFFY